MNSNSFVDVLFILLACTLVMLSQSIPGISQLNPELPAVAGGQPSDGAATVYVVVTEDDLHLLDADNDPGDVISFATVNDLLAANEITPDARIVVGSATREVSHHRVMTAYSVFRDKQYQVSLGVRPNEQSE